MDRHHHLIVVIHLLFEEKHYNFWHTVLLLPLWTLLTINWMWFHRTDASTMRKTSSLLPRYFWRYWASVDNSKKLYILLNPILKFLLLMLLCDIWTFFSPLKVHFRYCRWRAIWARWWVWQPIQLLPLWMRWVSFRFCPPVLSSFHFSLAVGWCLLLKVDPPLDRSPL